MIIIEHRFKGKLVWTKLVRNISKNVLHYHANKVDQAVGYGTNKSKCSCLIFITYEFLNVCTISKKTKLNMSRNTLYYHTKEAN